MADEASGYLPGSIKEFVKFGISGAGMIILIKKFTPGLAIKSGISDGVWVKSSDGSGVMFVPTIPTKSA